MTAAAAGGRPDGDRQDGARRSTSARSRCSASASRGVVRVVGTSSERGTLGASGFIDIGGLGSPLGNVSKPVAVAGAGAELTLKLTESQLREARRRSSASARVTVRLSVVATDAAGNSAAKRAPRIRARA